MKTQRIYIDTSVAGALNDPEFAPYTSDFFNLSSLGHITILESELMLSELLYASESVIEAYKRATASCNIIRIADSEEAWSLAQLYLDAQVVGATSLVDCKHIALATIANADLLTSWNFKHIVNVTRIRGYNSVNLSNGYQYLEIRNPREIITP